MALPSNSRREDGRGLGAALPAAEVSTLGTWGTVLIGLAGVVGLSQRESAREAGASGAGQPAGAVICFVLCAAIVGYGIYLIVA